MSVPPPAGAPPPPPKGRTGLAGRRDYLHAGLHVAIALGLVATGLQLAAGVRSGTPANCLYPHDFLPDIRFAAVGAAGLLFGRYLGHIRSTSERKVQDSIFAKLMARAALLLVFLLLVPTWFYEAMGTAHVALDASRTLEFQPITYYVRCAIYHDVASDGGVWTIIAVVVVSIVVGHWLWPSHPDREERFRSLRAERGRVSTLA